MSGEDEGNKPAWDLMMDAYPRYVAMCDILGFREMLETHGAEKLASKLEGLIGIATNTSYSPKGTFSYRPNHVLFSDTVLLWSDTSLAPIEFKYHGMAFLLLTSLFFMQALRSGTPLRVGVAYGNVVLEGESNLFVGQPIVDAYMTEQVQEWVGVACHESCFAAPGSYEQGTALDGNFHGPMVGYDIPFKNNGAFAARHTLNWPAWEAPQLEPTVEQSLRDGVSRYVGTPFEARWTRALEYFLYRRKSYPWGHTLDQDILEEMFAEQRGVSEVK